MHNGVVPQFSVTTATVISTIDTTITVADVAATAAIAIYSGVNRYGNRESACETLGRGKVSQKQKVSSKSSNPSGGVKLNGERKNTGLAFPTPGFETN